MRQFLLLFLITAFCEGVVIGSFKLLRPFFSPANITTSKIVGYAQYYGYPFSFDTIAFLLFLFVPIMVLVMSKRWIKV